MARDVDRIILYVREQTDIAPVQRQVMVNRLDPPPTQEELDRASAQVYPKEGAWLASSSTSTTS